MMQFWISSIFWKMFEFLFIAYNVTRSYVLMLFCSPLTYIRFGVTFLPESSFVLLPSFCFIALARSKNDVIALGLLFSQILNDFIKK